jgi:hypothetical protein
METEFTCLVENAFDFVEHSMDDLEATRPKYSVINFYSGVELFLKARLLKEHWALCTSKVSKMAKSDFTPGGFESIGLNDAKDRLSNIMGCSIPKAESSVYKKLRKRRKQAVHFYQPDDLRSEKKVAVEQLSGWHFLNHGCIRCGFHIQKKADIEPPLEHGYSNDMSTWQQRREWINERWQQR